MTKFLALTIGTAAVALCAAPASADHGRHYRHHARACERWRHGDCVRWNNHGYMVSTAMHDRYRVGYVYTNNQVYVVDPATYAITRILTGR